ncbi:MAG: type II toxin-antitoxin system RelE/ParE family toxin [Pyrinomonadaceae bacterium]|jgi:toxin ParE1/3/4|nr:type II toxin-antitoxin system RelE/ParE family toxin [Pyrinomonadaceae bacterium]
MSDLIKKTTPEFSTHALTDLEEIWLYHSEISENSADKILKQLLELCNKLNNFPKIGRERNELVINLKSFPKGKYTIFYQEISLGVEIVRVLHNSRDIEQVFEEMLPLQP